MPSRLLARCMAAAGSFRPRVKFPTCAPAAPEGCFLSLAPPPYDNIAAAGARTYPWLGFLHALQCSDDAMQHLMPWTQSS